MKSVPIQSNTIAKILDNPIDLAFSPCLSWRRWKSNDDVNKGTK